MKRRSRRAVAFSILVAGLLASFVAVGAQPAAAQYPVECHNTPYVYANVTVYKLHTDNLDCHTVLGHTDYLIDHDQNLAGFQCSSTSDHTKIFVDCTNLSNRSHRFEAKWITHPPTICPTSALTPVSTRLEDAT